MNQIGAALGIPPGGWNHGQSRLFEGGDLRLLWLSRRLAHRQVAERVAQNLTRASQAGTADLMLTVVTAAREHSTALDDVSMHKIDTWHQGGLDFLWAERRRLGLPDVTIRAWRGRQFFSHETGNVVYPAVIPARDQVLAYAAQLRASYEHHFRKHLDAIVGPRAATRVAQVSRVARLVWKAYAFLAPGGADYVPTKTLPSQAGRSFGCRSALGFLAHRAETGRAARFDLDEIVTLPDLAVVEWVRSARVRTAEALFLERMLTVVREILPMEEPQP